MPMISLAQTTLPFTKVYYKLWMLTCEESEELLRSCKGMQCVGIRSAMA